MDLERKLLIIAVFYSIIFITYSSYIYKEIQGNIINNAVFNFSIFLRNGSGKILYSFDKDNLIEIEIKEFLGENYLYLQFERKISNKVKLLKTLCNCLKCIDIQLDLVLDFQRLLVSIKCNGKLSILNNNYNDKAASKPFVPKHPMWFYLNKFNRTYIWMGNIGPYLVFEGPFIYALESQLFGCLNYFYINETFLLELNQRGNYFHLSCISEYVENVCNRNNCRKVRKFYNKFDCSIETIYNLFCKIDLYIDQYFPFNNNFDNKFIRIDWKHVNEQNYGLLEIVLLNNSYILFHVSDNNEMIMNSKQLNARYETILKSNITINKTNSLLVYLDKLDFFVKIFNGIEVNSYYENMYSGIHLINIGAWQHTNNWVKFNGYMNIRFEKSYNYVTRITTMVIKSLPYSKIKIIPFIVCGLIIIIIIVTIVLLIFHFKKGNKSNENVKGNRTKTPSPNQYEFELNEAQNNINQYDVINADDKPSEENDYSMIL